MARLLFLLETKSSSHRGNNSPRVINYDTISYLMLVFYIRSLYNTRHIG